MESLENNVSRKRHHDSTIPVLVNCANQEHHNSDTIKEIFINKNDFIIGRGRGSDQFLFSPFISRTHCTFHKNDEAQWTLIDSSSSCTLLNGVAIKQPQIVKAGDKIQLSPCEEFQYVLEMRIDDGMRENKKPRMNKCLMDDVLQKQKSFQAGQNLQLQEMKQQIEVKEKHQADLKSRLDELMTNLDAAQGEYEEKKQEIKTLQDQIETGNKQQEVLRSNVTKLVETLETERKEFEQKLTAEKQKWQEALALTEQEKKTFEKDMENQMKVWQDQQLEALAKEKNTMQEKMNQLETALKEQQAAAEKMQTSLQNQQVILARPAANQECVFFRVDNVGAEQTIEILETVDLTNDDDDVPKKNEKAIEQVMHAMDQHLTCSMCLELFYKATTLNCTHTFCLHCIRQWRIKKNECPNCRAKVISMNRALALDNFIDEAVLDLPLEDRARRAKMIKERDDFEKRRVIPIKKIIRVPQRR